MEIKSIIILNFNTDKDFFQLGRSDNYGQFAGWANEIKTNSRESVLLPYYFTSLF